MLPSDDMAQMDGGGFGNVGCRRIGQQRGIIRGRSPLIELTSARSALCQLVVQQKSNLRHCGVRTKAVVVSCYKSVLGLAANGFLRLLGFAVLLLVVLLLAVLLLANHVGEGDLLLLLDALLSQELVRSLRLVGLLIFRLRGRNFRNIFYSVLLKVGKI